MAKDNRVGEADSPTLAERLFAAAWNPSSGYTPESLADKCLDAAEAFERTRRKRAEEPNCPSRALPKG